MNVIQYFSVVLLITAGNLHSIYSCIPTSENSGTVSIYKTVQRYTKFSGCWQWSVEDDDVVKVSFKTFRVRRQITCPTTRGYWYRTSETTVKPEFPGTFIRIGVNDGRVDDIVFQPNSDPKGREIAMHRDFNISLEVGYNSDYCSNVIVEMEFLFERITGIKGIEGVDEARKKATAWLVSRLALPLKWKEDIQRSIVSLQLADGINLSKVDLMEELLIRQLDLKSSVALLRNDSDPVSMNKMAMMINALLITCHNPRNFFGYNLVKLLKDDVIRYQPSSPAPYLALCNANETLPSHVSIRLLNVLSSNAKYPFLGDIQALTIMTLSCMRFRNWDLPNTTDDLYIYAINKLQDEQLSDGSFGNIYSTAVYTQALMSEEKVNHTDKHIHAAVKFLIKQLNSTSTMDFLSIYYTLPILNEKTLLDIGYTDCSKYPKRDRDGASDVENKLGKKIMVHYSLFVGDRTDVVHTIALRVAEGSSAYDIMRRAAEVDPKYRFEWKMKSNQLYIYTIAGITNDPEDGHYWLMYYKEKNNTDMKHIIKSPEQVYVSNESHLIFWYKTVHLP